MDKMRSLLALILVAATVTVFQTGCSSDNNNNGVGVESKANGTSDGGGGDIDLSTPEQIKEAVESARALMLDITFLDNFFNLLNFSKLEGVCQQNGFINLFAKAMKLPPDLTIRIRAALIYEIDGDYLKFRGSLGINDCLRKELDILKRDYSLESLAYRPHGERKYDPDRLTETAQVVKEYIGNIEVFYVEDKPCPANNNQHADASVSNFTRNAKICFSTKLLSRIPPDSLEAYILGLWVHELGHMAGEKGEYLPTLLEKMAVKNYHRIKKRFHTNPLKEYDKDFGSLVGASARLDSCIAKIIKLGASCDTCQPYTISKGPEKSCKEQAEEGLLSFQVSLINFNNGYAHPFKDVLADYIKPEVRQKYKEPLIEIREGISEIDSQSLFDIESVKFINESHQWFQDHRFSFDDDHELGYRENLFTTLDPLFALAHYDPRNLVESN